MRGLAYLMLCTVALSGCFKGPSEPHPTASTTSSPTGSVLPTSSPTVGPVPPSLEIWDARLEMVDCMFGNFAVQVDGNELRSHLPEGFEPSGLAVDDVAQVNLNVYECDGIIVDNRTVMEQVSFATTSGIVSTNETLSKDADIGFYVFEFFTENESLQNVFSQAGFPTIRGSPRIEYSPNMVEMSITVNGTIWYEGRGSHYEDPPFPVQHIARWFHVPAGLSPRWANYEEDYSIIGFVDAAALVVNDGFLHQIRPGSEGLSPAASNQYLSKGFLTFDRL